VVDVDERSKGKGQRSGQTSGQKAGQTLGQTSGQTSEVKSEKSEVGGQPKRTISGPGAADFLAAQGGEDIPGVSPNKGATETRGESEITNPRNLVPRLGPDDEAEPGERAPDEDLPGSATGTIGGGGPDAHNRSPVRATGVDDPTVSGDRDSD